MSFAFQVKSEVQTSTRSPSSPTQTTWLRGEPFARRSVAIREKALGPDHPDVAADLAALAALLDGQGKYAEAEARYRRALTVFERVFACLSGEPDFEYALIDGTIVTAHQKASGARGGTENQAIGRSRGGLTTKIVALTDALGTLARFVLLPGQRHDSLGVPPLIEDVAFGALLGDKAFDIDWLRAALDERGATAVIPPKANRKAVISFDRAMYRWRHLIENTFAKLKEFRAVATRYDKTDTSYAATIHLAAAMIAAR